MLTTNRVLCYLVSAELQVPQLSCSSALHVHVDDARVLSVLVGESCMRTSIMTAGQPLIRHTALISELLPAVYSQRHTW